MTRIVELARADANAVARLGGKAANLARMQQAGLPVPAAFVVTSDAFREFLGGSELAPLFFGQDAGGTEDLLGALERTGWSRQDVFEKLQETIARTEMPAAIAREIEGAYRGLGGGKVAVRSSATDEDSRDASFAGQYDTFLNVEGEAAVADAVRRCWSSVANYRSYVYRKQGGIRPADLSIAVVVQRMVPAEVSGVLFTANPLGGRTDQMLLEASWGLGEGIVNGQVATDSFVIDKGSFGILSKIVRYKLHTSSGSEDGRTELVTVAPDRREIPSITDERAADLARLGVKVKDLFGGEQDIEWAASNGSLHLLQARPITTLGRTFHDVVDVDPGETNPEIRARTMWSMMDAGEATVGIMTPLSQDFMLYYRDRIHPKCLRISGIRDNSNCRPALGFVYGRCFLNVSHLAHKFSQVPLFRDPTPLLKRFASEEIDSANYKTPYPPGAKGLASLWAAIYWMSQQPRVFGWKKARQKATDRRYQTYDEVVDRDLTKLSMEELHAEILKRQDTVDESGLNYFPFYFLTFAAYDALTQACQKLLPGQGVEQKLKAEISELRTIDVTTDLWQLAEKARAIPEVKKVLLETPASEVRTALGTTETGRAFLRDVLAPLLRKHGVRGRPPEMEYMTPRWADDPTVLFQMAKTYIAKDFKVDQVLERSEKDRKAATAEALAKLPWVKRKLLKTVIGLYCTFGETREITRMWAMTETWALRRAVMEVARRMVEKGILRSMEEVAFVPFRDLLAFAAGTKRPEEFTRDAIEANRRQHLFNLRVPDPPLTFVGPYDPSKRHVRDEAREVLEGVGTSPGRAEGRARVIMDLDAQASEFQPGEILVAHFTNATWTPLFVTAAAVVVDLGSILAHSAIVAREYGIPCVANTYNATRLIRTGDRLVVDGDAGKVLLQR